MPQLTRGGRAVLNELLDLAERIKQLGHETRDNSKMSGYVEDVGNDIVQTSRLLTDTLLDELKPLLERREGSPAEIATLADDLQRVQNQIKHLQQQIDDMNTAQRGLMPRLVDKQQQERG